MQGVSCVVQDVLSAPQDLRYVIKNCALSYPLPNIGDIFIPHCLCLHVYLFIFKYDQCKPVIILAASL